MVKFAYNNVKNANISYIFFKFNKKYYLYIFFKDNTYLYLKLYFNNKLFQKQKKLITISQQNLLHAQHL